MIMSKDGGGMITVSTKQQFTSRSSTAAELIVVDDVVAKIVWASRFLEGQGFAPGVPSLYQNNQSSILLETKGMDSVGKWSHHILIRLFFIQDLVDKGTIAGIFPTDSMKADFMTKPLQGGMFLLFKKVILGQQ